jgi:hypothetical protein
VPGCCARTVSHITLVPPPPRPCSYGLTWAFIIFTTVFSLLLLANTVTLPRTVQGFTCYGMMTSCTPHDVCMEWDADAVGSGSQDGKEGVPNMTTWKYCDFNSINKMMSPICVYDEVSPHMHMPSRA